MGTRHQWALLVLLALIGSRAEAQTITEADRQQRVQRMIRANEARQAGRFADALSLVQSAEQIGVTAGTRSVSAQLLVELGRHAEAMAAAEDCLRMVDIDAQLPAANRETLRASCVAARDRASRQVARLTLRVPASIAAVTEVRVNGDVFPVSRLNVVQVLDPGAVTVFATAPGREAWQRTLTLRPGESLSLDVAPPEAPRPETAPAARVEVQRPAATPAPTPLAMRRDPTPARSMQQTPEPPGPAELPAPGRTQRGLAWASGALGLALVGGGVASGLMFMSQRDEYERERCAYIARTDDCDGRYGTLETLRTLAFAGSIGGGLLVATSVVLFATAPSARRPPTVSLHVTPGMLGMSWTQSF